MTKKGNLALLIVFAALCRGAIDQESPTPTPSPASEESPSFSPIPSSTPDESPSPSSSISPTAEESPSPSPSPALTRNIRIRFVPPPMESTISLGIFDETGNLVRILHRESKIDNFTVDADSLSTTWDGKNDAGQDSPPGRYRGRGYAVGQLKVEDLGKAKKPPPTDGADRVAVTLTVNPLLSDTRSVVDIGVGVDGQGSFLRTMDGLPLFPVSKTPNLVRASITKNGKKSADVWQDDGAAMEQFRVSNIDQMMAFDCGFFELK